MRKQIFLKKQIFLQEYNSVIKIFLFFFIFLVYKLDYEQLIVIF